MGKQKEIYYKSKSHWVEIRHKVGSQIKEMFDFLSFPSINLLWVTSDYVLNIVGRLDATWCQSQNLFWTSECAIKSVRINHLWNTWNKTRKCGNLQPPNVQLFGEEAECCIWLTARRFLAVLLLGLLAKCLIDDSRVSLCEGGFAESSRMFILAHLFNRLFV